MLPGVAKADWGLGQRVLHAPTFDYVLDLGTARTDLPGLTPHENIHRNESSTPANHLQKEIATRALAYAVRKNRISQEEADKLYAQHLERAYTISELAEALEQIGSK